MIPSLKDKSNPELIRGAVYSIPCADCNGIYIGETARNVITRIKEHKRDLQPQKIAELKEKELNKKSALVKHAFTKQHRINFQKYKILESEPDYNKRRFLESFHINKNKNAFNDKESCFYSKIYNKFIINNR